MEASIEQVSPPVETLQDFYESRYEAFFLQVARYIAKQGGTLDDAKDIYHDALILYYEKRNTPGFVLQTNEESYITGIVKNRWARQIQKDRRNTRFDTEDVSDKATDSINEERLYALVVAAGKKCLDLLSAFYGGQISLKEVASNFGFRSEHSAAVQKYKCLEKIREKVKQNALCHEDFFE